MGDFWIIVHKVVTDEPVAFIMTPEEVQQRAHASGKADKISYWLEPRDYDVPEFREQWGRIGHGHPPEAIRG
jgi:hypothetical protein